MSDPLFIEDLTGDPSLAQVHSTREVAMADALVISEPADDATEHADLPFLSAAMRPTKKGKQAKQKGKQAKDKAIVQHSESDLDSVDQDYINNLDQLELNEYVFQVLDSDDYENNNKDVQFLSDSDSESDSDPSDELSDEITDDSEEEELHIENLSRKNRKKSKAARHAVSNASKAKEAKPKRSPKSKGKKKQNVVQLEKVMDDLNSYLAWVSDDKSPPYFQFEPMPRHIRKVFHLAVNITGCRSKSSGKGQMRYITVDRSPKCQYPSDNNLKKIHDMLNRSKNTLSGWQEDSKGTSKNKSTRKNGTDQQRPVHGQIVGENAEPISDSNKGHQLLVKMGWSVGATLGSTSTAAREANAAPIEVKVRAKGRGLGFN